jgi:hypothetical protein
MSIHHVCFVELPHVVYTKFLSARQAYQFADSARSSNNHIVVVYDRHMIVQRRWVRKIAAGKNKWYRTKSYEGIVFSPQHVSTEGC